MRIRSIKQNTQKGFTLIEMLVSIAVFMSVLTVALSSLVSIINANKRTQEIKSVVDNVTFVIDSLSRNARNATNYSCSPDGLTYVGDCIAGGSYFQYQKDGAPTRYRFVATPLFGEGNIQRCDKSICSPGIQSDWQSMTAPTSTVNVTNLTFYVLGTANENAADATQRTQPRVIITTEGIITERDGTQTKFNLQTTASQRSRKSGN